MISPWFHHVAIVLRQAPHRLLGGRDLRRLRLRGDGAVAARGPGRGNAGNAGGTALQGAAERQNELSCLTGMVTPLVN